MKPRVYLPLIMLIGHLFTGSYLHALEGADIAPVATEVKGEVWPEVTVKVLIKAPPIEAAAIFAAYDYQKEYVPGLIKSEVVVEKVKGAANDTQVSYTMDLPWPLGESHYIHGHELTSPKKNSYKIRWYMVKSDSAKKVEGYALFSPHPEDPKFTLMSYKSLVTPDSFLAGALKKLMIGDVKNTLQNIRKTIEDLVSKKSPLVTKYTNKIKDVLSGQNAYLKGN